MADVVWHGESALFYKKASTLYPGANPTIAIYNTSVVNFYNAKGSLKLNLKLKLKFLIYFEKRYSLLQRWCCSCKF
jgi:hypothetical protein